MIGYEQFETGEKDEVTFEELYPSLIGPEGLKQFLVHQNELYCIRLSCEGCPFFNNGCEHEDSNLPIAVVPHSRRGVGFEERAFLILKFRVGHSFETLPLELWDNPHADKAYAHEANLHWALTDPDNAVFHTLKGQLRYYGSAEDFVDSQYAEYLTIFRTYEPQHYIASLDYSAIEPRLSTLCSKEPEWIKVFKGTPKPIFREVEISDVAS
jgi:hypothetical protein